MKVRLEAIESSGLRNVVAIKIVEHVESPDHGHHGHVQLSHKTLGGALEELLINQDVYFESFGFSIFWELDDLLVHLERHFRRLYIV